MPAFMGSGPGQTSLIRNPCMHEALKRLLDAVRVSSGPLSTKLRGDLYEELSLWALQTKLQPLGLKSLHRVGRTGDRGVDLIGNWQSMDLLVQCKSGKSKISSALWRDLSGVGLRRTKNCHVPSIVALVSPMPMTTAGLVEFMSSDQALLHFLLPWSAKLNAGEVDPEPLKSTVVNLAAENLLNSKKISGLSGFVS